jgi:acyl homoserine lactone synthase
MEVSILRIPDGLPDWDLVLSYLRLRKSVFMDRLGWPLYELGDCEFEQYDTVHAVYVIAHDDRSVLGGARLLRTSDTIGSGRCVYSYMIRDACRNLLPGLPSDLCYADPPVAKDMWELTRLVSKGSAKVGAEILAETNRFLRAQKARSCLFLAPPAFMRMASRLGYAPVPLGDVRRNIDGQFLAFQCEVV